MQVLSAEELRQFRLIEKSAHREGWLSADAALIAERCGSSVRVASVCGSSVVEKNYSGDARWLFQLVRDLAWGSYQPGASPQKTTRTSPER